MFSESAVSPLGAMLRSIGRRLPVRTERPSDVAREGIATTWLARRSNATATGTIQAFSQTVVSFLEAL